MEVAQAKKRVVVTWSLTEGLVGLPSVTPDEYTDPSAALRYITKQFDPEAKNPVPHLFVMKDLHKIMANDISVVRALRDVAVAFEVKHNMILLAPTLDIPEDLSKTIAVMDYPLPDFAELCAILKEAQEDLAESSVKIDLADCFDTIVEAMLGLTETEATNVLKSAVVATHELSKKVIPYITSEKKQIIRKAGVLEFIETNLTINDVGGLSELKRYAQIKAAAFTPQAKAAGVDSPKGLLLVGFPGTGKSLVAKVIASIQNAALLRMDVGALMGGLVGQSESNTRTALKVAEASGRVVLWIDEIEKALGTSGGEMDGGTMSRVFGTILTWMQETTAPVYVIATANDVQSLRPELLRRFDDVMWVGFPAAEARKDIAKLHLAKRNHSIKSLDALVAATWGFSGAEIEKVVKSAVENCFFEKATVTEAHLLESAKLIVPISVTMKEQIVKLEEWMKNRSVRQAGEVLEAQPRMTTKSKAMAEI